MIAKYRGISIPMSFVRRRFFALSFMAFIFLGAGSLNLEALIKGDINNDGRVDIQDSIRSLRMHIGTEAVDLPKGDLNYDSLVNPTDADLILKMGLGLVTLPPDPVSVALPPDPTVATNLSAATSFLYTGPNPIQTGVTSGTIDGKRVAVIRGKVMTREGLPLSGVVVTILNHPEYGQTLTRDDGMLDMVVNGGGYLIVNYQKAGYLSAQRQIQVPWQDYGWLPDVTLIQQDNQMTTIDLSASIPVQVAQGSTVTDSRGSRRSTLLIPQGTTATAHRNNLPSQSLNTLSIRLTEYTVGDAGPKAMPAELPPTSGYTFALEMTADEALALGAEGIIFSQPLYYYVENFINLPVGTHVPVAYYDSKKGAWVPEDDGRVIKVLTATGGKVDLDTDGDGVADDPATLASLGITDAEREKLAGLYQPGQSLWRVPVSHFTSWDCNVAIRAVQGAPTGPLNLTSVNTTNIVAQPTYQPGYGVFEAENQIFHESAAVVGTPFGLHYASDRVRGYQTANTINVAVTNNTVSPYLLQVHVHLIVAGQAFFMDVVPSGPNQVVSFTWDGKDAYGRLVQGAQPVKIRVEHHYPGCYLWPPNVPRSFGLTGLDIFPGCIVAPSGFLLVQEQVIQMGGLGSWDERALGLGGWRFNVHHVYDPVGRILHLGNGRRRSATSMTPIIATVAGTGSKGFSGNGGASTKAQIAHPTGVTVGPDGSFYIADFENSRIRRVDPDGTISTFAGKGNYGFSGDGGQAVEAALNFPKAIVFGPDGSAYIVDNGNNRIRRVDKNGIITTVVGTGERGYGGDGGPAAQAKLNWPAGIAIAPDGTLYIADTANHRIRRVGPDGSIYTIAGTGTSGFFGDGGPAIEAKLVQPVGLALGPDGSLYLADSGNRRVRRVSTSGIITTVAGGGPFLTGEGDGGPATEAFIADPLGVALGADGSLFISDSTLRRIRRVSPDGVISTYAGTGTGQVGFSGDNGPATGAKFQLPSGIAIGPDGSVYIADTLNHRIRSVMAVLPPSTSGEIAIPSENGTEIYVFTAAGRHERTVQALTKAILHQFAYDSANRLISITDGDGYPTTIDRNVDGNPQAIIGPFGLQTTLSLNADGYLSSVTNPAGEQTQYAYGSGGLFASVTGPQGERYDVTYDSLGRVVGVSDPAGGRTTLTRSETATGFEVTQRTALGRETRFLVENLPAGGQKRVTVFPDQTQTVRVTGADGSTTTTSPEGTVTKVVPGPDPRFGMQAPIDSSRVVTVPGGPVPTTTMTRTFLNGNLTDEVTINGRTFTTVFDGSSMTYTRTSPTGRETRTTIDAMGRPTRTEIAGTAPVSAKYDSHGRPVTVTVGSGLGARVNQNVYNAQGWLESTSDAIDRISSFTYDAAGRVIRKTFPDGREAVSTYTPNGGLSSITPPGRPSHFFTYTPIDLMESYAAPAVGSEDTTTGYTYNVDRQQTSTSLPGGRTIVWQYDVSGHLQNLSSENPAGGAYNYSYDAGTGNLSVITSPDGGKLMFSYKGSLVTGQNWAVNLSGSVGFQYDNNFWLTTRTVNGGNSSGFQYDLDGLLIKAGDLTISRDAQNGRLTGTTLEGLTDSYSYNDFGEISGYVASYSGSPFYQSQYTRDKLGRITQKVETVNGVTDTYEYSYALAGRLEKVERTGSVSSTANYAYDNNGNRTSYSGPFGMVSGVYDAQDRVVNYGGVSYTYNANGELTLKGTTNYQYDTLGNLVKVSGLPGGKTVEYILDGKNRRIGKKSNGVLTQQFIYQNTLAPAAELNGAGSMVSLFFYGTRINVPDYIVKAGVPYRMLTDHLGSVRLVIKISDGTVAQRIDYDEFGRVLSDTNPGFQPFGFAGGIYDPDTKLTRFGVRDYDAEAGRWTSRDPILFAGKSLNLYAYVNNNPMNFNDPLGLGPPGPGSPVWDNSDIMTPQQRKNKDNFWRTAWEGTKNYLDLVGQMIQIESAAFGIVFGMGIMPSTYDRTSPLYGKTWIHYRPKLTLSDLNEAGAPIDCGNGKPAISVNGQIWQPKDWPNPEDQVRQELREMSNELENFSNSK